MGKNIVDLAMKIDSYVRNIMNNKKAYKKLEICQEIKYLFSFFIYYRTKKTFAVKLLYLFTAMNK
jgi:hypothetical protein